MITVHVFGEGAHVGQAVRRYAGVPGVVTRVYADADLDEFPNLAAIDPARILLLEVVTWGAEHEGSQGAPASVPKVQP
jgi:hypothetical protein